jgi:citrate synthase
MEKPQSFQCLNLLTASDILTLGLIIRNLHAQTNHFTFDPGFTATGSCSSKITEIDGNAGRLLYRGYDIRDLAENCTYLEVCYLLLYGELPSKVELEGFENAVKNEMMLHENMIEFYQSFEKDSHPMAIMVGIVGALSAFMKESEFNRNKDHRAITAIKMIAKMPMIAALAFRTSRGLPIVYPKEKYSYIENFLRMMFKNPLKPWKCDPLIIKAIEVIFILHADHEQNASTSTVRIAASSQANPYACIAAGIASLWGPSHGGANEAVISMLEEIESSKNIPTFVEKVKDKNSGVRLMGFGHRVYKNYDPRAKLMKDLAMKIASQIDSNGTNELLQLALELERIALTDEYFVKRNLYPNVDYYTGIIYRTIGIPKNMFTVMFALSRTVGWISQLLEMTSEPMRIGRPRQLYVGYMDRTFIKIEDRKDQNRIVEVPKQCDYFQLPIL